MHQPVLLFLFHFYSAKLDHQKIFAYGYFQVILFQRRTYVRPTN